MTPGRSLLLTREVDAIEDGFKQLDASSSSERGMTSLAMHWLLNATKLAIKLDQIGYMAAQ